MATLRTVLVSVTPSRSVISAGNSLQFATKPPMATAGHLNWQVDGVLGGGPLMGTISPSGLYRAPQVVTANTLVTITVRSTTARSHVNDATITLVPNHAPVVTSISPTGITLSPSQNQQFTATGTGATNIAVNWFVNGTQGGYASVGTISPMGLYTAPQVVPAASSVSITAISAYDATNSVTATVALNASSTAFKPSAAVAPPIGINMSEAEYSWGSFPGANDLAYMTSNKITIIRLPIAWERAQPKLGGPLDTTYLAAMKAFIASVGAEKMQVIIDLHDYGRYNSHWAQDIATNGVATPGSGTDPDDIIGSAAVPISAFADFWRQLADALKGTAGLAYYDLMNEPHDMGGTSVWPSAAQAAVDAVRSVDMKTAILVEGTQWASAFWWPSDNGNLHITDPANNLFYEAHLYFDSDGSGTYKQSYATSGAYPNVGVDRLQPFLTWLKNNRAQGFLGEFGVPNTDPQWLPVLDNFLTALQAAGLSGTYWNYAFHSPSDPSWWPVNDPMSIINDGRANPQMGILSKHNTPSS